MPDPPEPPPITRRLAGIAQHAQTRSDAGVPAYAVLGWLIAACTDLVRAAGTDAAAEPLWAAVQDAVRCRVRRADPAETLGWLLGACREIAGTSPAAAGR